MGEKAILSSSNSRL